MKHIETHVNVAEVNCSIMMIAFLKKKTDFAIHQTFVTGFTSFDPNLRGPMIKSSWHLSCERCRVDTLSFCRMPNREALAPMQVA